MALRCDLIIRDALAISNAGDSREREGQCYSRCDKTHNLLQGVSCGHG